MLPPSLRSITYQATCLVNEIVIIIIIIPKVILYNITTIRSYDYVCGASLQFLQIISIDKERLGGYLYLPSQSPHDARQLATIK